MGYDTSKTNKMSGGLGNKPPTTRGQGKRTKPQAGPADPGGTEVTQENRDNVIEQGTGRRKVRLLPGATASNRR